MEEDTRRQAQAWGPYSPLMLERLRPELLLIVAGNCGLLPLLSLSQVSRGCREAARDEQVWRALLVAQLRPMTKVFFGGVIPSPGDGRTWKQHYFELRWSWKQLAQERTGRILVQIGAQWPSGRRPNELVSIWNVSDMWYTTGPDYFGVYDCTDFVAHHPGADLIIRDAATAADATSTFEMAAHSDIALQKLATLVVTGLEALPYDHDLVTLRRRSRLRWLDQVLCVGPAPSSPVQTCPTPIPAAHTP